MPSSLHARIKIWKEHSGFSGKFIQNVNAPYTNWRNLYLVMLSCVIVYDPIYRYVRTASKDFTNIYQDLVHSVLLLVNKRRQLTTGSVLVIVWVRLQLHILVAHNSPGDWKAARCEALIFWEFAFYCIIFAFLFCFEFITGSWTIEVNVLMCH